MRYLALISVLLLCGAALDVAAGQEAAQDPEAYLALGFEPPLGLDAPRLSEPPAGAPVEGAALERRTEEVASLMRCPVCQGLSVADSPTDSALAMKREVREMVAAGYSEEQILGYFERSYGEFIRLAPKATGFNLLVWIAPVLGVLVGALLIAARIRSTRSAGGEARAKIDPELEPYLERVRREVAG